VVVNAPPDGYTLLFINPANAINGKRPTIHVCDLIVADDMFAL
jgi:hypothetical protein